MLNIKEINMANMSISQFVDRLEEIYPEITRGFVSKQTNEIFKGKITIQQFLVMEYLNRKKECKMSCLAQYLSITTAAITGTVQRLVKAGYVARVFDPRDRRIINIKLTAKGAELVTRISEQRKEMITRVFAKLTGQERENYLKVLQRIREVLIEERDKDAK